MLLVLFSWIVIGAASFIFGKAVVIVSIGKTCSVWASRMFIL